MMPRRTIKDLVFLLCCSVNQKKLGIYIKNIFMKLCKLFAVGVKMMIMKSQLLLSLQENGFLMCTRILALVTILCKNPKGRRTFFYFDLSHTFMEVLTTIYLKNYFVSEIALIMT